MSEYRKKPVVIEAVQWNPRAKPLDLPPWFMNLIGLNPEHFNERTGELSIHTLEGVMVASPGDWIIKGIKGELYPCKPDIFDATYEPV